MKKLAITLGLGFAIAFQLGAQTTDTTLQAVPLRETVISANRSRENREAVAQQVVVLDQKLIAQMNAQSTADLLIQSGAVFVQKSQQGGGSPVLRGFEASRVLLVVDGIRMNNAIYRAGHLQNVITLDNASFERAEILFGPASTVYGSDALGGALCFYTKNPLLANEGENFRSTGSAFARYGTVNEEKTGHVDVSLAGQHFGSLTSFTYSDFGDLKMGGKEGPDGAFGERPYYVDRINGVDSLVKNSDPLVQRYTGFSQYDLVQKFLWKPGMRTSHLLNIQYSNSSNIPRYDRLTDPGANGGLASAEWYYGPQKRLMAAYTLRVDDLGWFDGLDATISWQDIDESRYNRNFGASRRTEREENVKVYGLIVNANKQWGSQSLNIGIDGQYNDVTSVARRVNVGTGEITTQSTRYPDGGSTVLSIAAYATHQWQPSANTEWQFSEGLRAGYTSLESKFTSREFYPLPFSTAEQSTPTISGSLGIVYGPTRPLRVALNLSSGFRVPNVDDMTKIFDSQKGSVVVPNPDLKPEKTFNAELSLTGRITDRLRWENVVWGTLFRDAIVTDVFQFNGQDSVDYDGVPSRVLASQNKREARLWGISSTLEADALDALAVYASVGYTHGRIQKSDLEAEQPLDHIPPMYGRVGLRWHTTRATAEGFCLFNGKKDIDDYNLTGEDNQQYAPADGMPAWATFNLRGSYSFGRYFTLQAGVDNLLDRQYRYFASGINAPGRNIWVTARVNW